MDDLISNNVINNIDNILESIKQIIINADRWIEVFEIAELLKVHRHQKLIANDNNSSISQLINRKLKKQGFKTKKVYYDKSYSIWVSPPGFSDDDFPSEGYQQSNFLDQKSKFKIVSKSTKLSIQHHNNPELEEVKIEKESELYKSDNIINFSNPDMVLKILLASDKPYEELKEICEKLVLEIEPLHTNANGLEYPSQLSQCILECFKIKNNFSSSTWYSNKNINENSTSDLLPITFSRITSKGEVVNYKLYNYDQIDKAFEYKKTNSIINNLSEPIRNEKLKQLLLNVIDNSGIYTSNQRNLSMFKLRYGLLEDDVKTLEDIASVYSISRERVRQIINGILKRLRNRTRLAFRQNAQGLLYELYSYLNTIVAKINQNCNDNKVDKVFIEQLLIEEFQSNNIIYLKLINQLTDNNFEILETIPPEKFSDTTNKKIRIAILACIREFSGLYGRSGIAKILKGSSALKNNEFTKGAIDSNFFGLCKQLTFEFINAEIDGLINEGALTVTADKNFFGRPLLSVNPDVKIEEIELCGEISLDNESENDDENVIKILKLLKQGENVFVTGHAGTGKSYILNRLKEKIKSLVVTSTTGIAAVNVKGQSLHSWAGVGICNKPIPHVVENILKKTSIRNQIQKCKILAIDEISMLNIETFEYVDLVLRRVRNIDKPFGGIQVILIGDFFQLPPVNNNREPIKYCFESNLWEDLSLHTIMLTKNYRQNEENFINALSNMRINSLSSDDINLLKTRESFKNKQQTDILHIFATNHEADNYNSLKFNELTTTEYKLFAIDGVYKGDKFIESPSNEKDTKILQRIDVVCSAEKSISLKIGARVMLLINLDFEKGLINGSCGNVNEIYDDFVLVRFDNGVEKKIEKHDFEFYNNDVLIAMRRQFPLRLAYGITIHKSQGMSLDKLVVDCSRIFEKGQAYVAISRVKTLNGLHLYSFNPAKVWADEKVVKFYTNLINTNQSL